MGSRSSNHRMGPTEWGYLFALAFLWSGVLFLAKVALGQMQPFTVVILRLGIGAIVLHVAVAAILNAGVVCGDVRLTHAPTTPPFTVLFDRPWAQPMPLMAAWVAVASAAVFCTALAYALYFRILATPGWFHASAATPPNRRSPRIAVAPEFCTTVPLREARDFAKACDFSEIA